VTHHPTPAPPAVIAGPRLDLVLVTVEQLLSRDPSGDPAREPVPLPYADPYDVLHPDRSPLRFRVAQVGADPSVNPWLLRLGVERGTGTIVGLVNFHAPPDEHGMVEIGYSVLPAFRGLGFAREMATTMWSYAADHPAVRVLRATVSPGNEASLAIIRGAGLVHVGEQDDPEDGLELVFEIAAADYAV
jgi:ribosomal-protein-alanine N-acetyltransferase